MLLRVMDIAYALRMPLRQLGDATTITELALWHVYLEEHAPETRHDRRMGRLMALLAKCHFAGDFTEEEFMLHPPAHDEDTLLGEDVFLRHLAAWAAAKTAKEAS